MEFECQGDIEAFLSDNFVEFVDHSSKEQVKSDKAKSHREDQVSRPKKDTDGAAVSKSASNSNPKFGIPSLCSSKSLPDDISLINRRSITDLPPALISEIFNCLDPKELGIVSCVSPILHKVASEHHIWKNFYCERWGIPTASKALCSKLSDEKTWKDLFVEREFRSKTFLGRYSIEALYGHKEAVRTIFMLPSAKLLFTSGYDCVVRMWNIEEGLSIASSRPLGCTIRAVAADTRLLVAGGTAGFIQCWRAAEGYPHLFDLKNHNFEFRLWEHEGPITCLALNFTRIFSGSWDMTVRVWDRVSLKCLNVLKHGDWVWGLVPHDTTVASVAGSDVYVWDVQCEAPRTVICDAHSGIIYAIARSPTGNLLFTGGEDGMIHMFEITANCAAENVVLVATWVPHTGAVNSLAFEFPWLVSASDDGKLSLVDVRKLLRTACRSSTKHLGRVNHAGSDSVEAPQRMLHGFGCNLFSVDIGSDRIVSGGEEGVVRVWNFSQALEIEQRARALRGIRLESRMRRRRLQMEMNGKNGSSDQCSIAAKKNLIIGDRRGSWQAKRVVSGKPKA